MWQMSDGQSHANAKHSLPSNIDDNIAPNSKQGLMRDINTPINNKWSLGVAGNKWATPNLPHFLKESHAIPPHSCSQQTHNFVVINCKYAGAEP